MDALNDTMKPNYLMNRHQNSTIIVELLFKSKMARFSNVALAVFTLTARTESFTFRTPFEAESNRNVAVASARRSSPSFIVSSRSVVTELRASDADADAVDLTEEEQVEQVGNLVADDEWMGLSMEITELVRVAVLEDVKSKTADFLGKDDYKVGDISKELDDRVKTEVAKLRGKDEYELGDLSLALDQMSKDLTCELTGKDDYEFGDLSVEIDRRLKDQVASFCGKDEYEFGDLSKEVDRRVRNGVAEFTGKGDYQFGDISREIESRRKKWVADTLGEEAASRYQFGDLTKKALSNFTGKDDYQFGDISKKLMGDLFGKRKRGGGDK